MIKNVLLIMFSLLLMSTIAMAKEYTRTDLYIVAAELARSDINISIVNKASDMCDWFLKTSKDPDAIDSAKNIKNRCEIERSIINGANSINDIPEKYLNSITAFPATNRLIKNDYLNSEKYLNDHIARYGIKPDIDFLLSTALGTYLLNKDYKNGIDLGNNFINKYPTLNTSNVKYHMMLLYLESGDKKTAFNMLDTLINDTKDYKEKADLLTNKLSIYTQDSMINNYYEIKKILVTLKRLGIENNDQEIINYANDCMTSIKEINEEIINGPQD